MSAYLYEGPGASLRSLNQTEKMLRDFDSSLKIKRLDPCALIETDWYEDCRLFVMPSGADLPYVRALKGAGNQKIKNYVENGGAYLGICAGSYYAGSFVDFAKDTPLSVQGKRELAFFKGTVKGPVLAPYDYNSHKGAVAATLTWQGGAPFEENSTFVTFYSGGGYFCEAHDKAKVLATYEEGHAAIIMTQVGKGRALLSGVHFEYTPEPFDVEDPYLQKLLPAFIRGETKRQALSRHLLHLTLG